MNIVYGFAAPGGAAGVSDRAADFAERLHGARPALVYETNELAAWGLSDTGVVFGRATSGDVQLLLLGTLHHPLEEWQGGAPVDDPNRAAAYLLRRFQRMGLAFLHNVTGQYAVVVFDAGEQRLLLAADPSGHRTLFCFQREQRLVFASNLRLLAEALGEELELDRSLEDFLMIYGFYPWRRTPFCNVASLDKGTIVEWRAGRIATHRIEYDDSRYGSSRDLSHATASEVVDELYEGFMGALKDQLTDDPRVGVLLGGFDSALVAAALGRLGKQVETFTFHYDDREYNQPHTDTLRAFLGHEHHQVKLTRDLLERGLRNFSVYFNQPTNWPNYVIQTADACERIRQHGIRFCYTGDGCDSVFMGYPGTYQRARVFQSLPVVPKAANGLLLKLLSRPLLDRRLGHPYRVLLNVVRALRREMPARGFLSFRIMDETSLDLLRQGERPPQEQAAEDIMRQLAEPHRGLPALRLAYLGKSAVSPNRNKMVGSSDRTGLALLSPYMHPGMKRLSLGLPEELCRPNETTPSKVTGKFILMKMAEDKRLLPKEVIYQRKVAAVDGPIDAWYAGPLRGVMLELMDGLPFAYSNEYANALLDEKLTETWFKRYVIADKVLSHAASLAATYGAFTVLARRGD